MWTEAGSSLPHLESISETVAGRELQSGVDLGMTGVHDRAIYAFFFFL